MTVERIIDANGNRAREALRVMEEAARFLLDDGELAAALKTLRHDLARTVAAFGSITPHRDVGGDVGTRISTPGEMTRATAGDVASAAGRRLGEALRAIEEYGKTMAPATAAEVERLRYAAYDLEQRLELRLGAGRARQWRVCVLLGAAVCPDGDWRRVAEAVTSAEPDCLQLREKGLDDAELLRRARTLVELARPGTAVVVNDRPDIALLAGAHGVHVGQRDLPVAEVRRVAGRRLLVGASTSRLEEAKAALAAGADYCGVGPMFPSTTKHKDAIAGPEYLRAYVAWGGLPHLAIGGITPDNVDRLVEAGVRGVAVSAAVCAAPDPAAVVRELQRALEPVPLSR